MALETRASADRVRNAACSQVCPAPCPILPTGAATVFTIAAAFAEAWQTKTGARLSRASLMECS